jgi:hypothetical protein
MKSRLLIIGIILIGFVVTSSLILFTLQQTSQQCELLGGKIAGLFSCSDKYPTPNNTEHSTVTIPDYSNLLKGAEKNIDIAHHIDITPTNSTTHAFSIKSINFNSDDSITVNFGGVNKHFMTIPEFNYTRTFQINDSFVFYCMDRLETGYPSMGIYKYLGTHVINENLIYAFYHGDAKSQNEFECIYPEIIEQSVNIFDIEVSLEMLQHYGLGKENEN